MNPIIIDNILLTELHLCYFCHGKMEDIEMNIHHCQRCDAYKTRDQLTDYVCFFERVFRDNKYRFSFYENNTFILSKDDRWGLGQEEIMRAQELDITPANWEKKLPTLLTFS